MALAFIIDSAAVSLIRRFSPLFVHAIKQQNGASNSAGPIFLQHQAHRKGTSLSDKSASSNEFDHLPPLTHPTNAIFRHYERNAQPATYGFQMSQERSSPTSRKSHYIPKTMNTTTTIKMPPGSEPVMLGDTNTPRSRKKTTRDSDRKHRKFWWSPKRNHIEIRSEVPDYHLDAQGKLNTFENIHWRPSGGQISIRDEPVHWQASPKVDSLSNVHWAAVPSRIAIRSERVQWDAEAKVDTMGNMDYRPTGGNVAIRDERMSLAHVTPRVDTGFVDE